MIDNCITKANKANESLVLSTRVDLKQAPWNLSPKQVHLHNERGRFEEMDSNEVVIEAEIIFPYNRLITGAVKPITGVVATVWGSSNNMTHNSCTTRL